MKLFEGFRNSLSDAIQDQMYWYITTDHDIKYGKYIGNDNIEHEFYRNVLTDIVFLSRKAALVWLENHLINESAQLKHSINTVQEKLAELDEKSSLAVVDMVKEYILKHPEQRFWQALVNMGVIRYGLTHIVKDDYNITNTQLINNIQIC